MRKYRFREANAGGKVEGTRLSFAGYWPIELVGEMEDKEEGQDGVREVGEKSEVTGWLQWSVSSALGS